MAPTLRPSATAVRISSTRRVVLPVPDGPATWITSISSKIAPRATNAADPPPRHLRLRGGTARHHRPGEDQGRLPRRGENPRGQHLGDVVRAVRGGDARAARGGQGTRPGGRAGRRVDGQHDSGDDAPEGDRLSRPAKDQLYQ